MNETDWIKDLKVGDEVIVVSGGWSSREYIAKVEKINKVTIKIDGALYSIASGYERTDSWRGNVLRQLKEGDRERLKTEEERIKLYYYLSHLDWSKYTIDQLRRVYKIIKE